MSARYARMVGGRKSRSHADPRGLADAWWRYRLGRPSRRGMNYLGPLEGAHADQGFTVVTGLTGLADLGR